MNLIKNNLLKNYTQIPNELIWDQTLSPQARCLFVLLASKPNDWKFYNNYLAKKMGVTVKTLQKYFKELIESGWISKEQVRSEGGQFKSNEYTVFDRRVLLPLRQKTLTVKTPYLQTKTNTKKEKVILEEIQKIYSEYFNNLEIILPTEQDSIYRHIKTAIDRIGYDKLLRNTKAYAKHCDPGYKMGIAKWMSNIEHYGAYSMIWYTETTELPKDYIEKIQSRNNKNKVE